MGRLYSANGDRIEYGTVSPPLTGTIHAWYYPTWNTTTEVSPRTLARTYRPSPLGLFDFLAYNGSGDSNFCYFGWYDANSSYIDSRYKIPAASVITQNTWKSVAMTWAQSGATLVYSNGVNVTSGGSYIGGSANCSSFNIGGNTNVLGNNAGDTTQHAKGSIAEFAIWSVVLNANELSALGSGVSPLLIRPTSLSLYIPVLGQSPESNYYNGSGGTVTGTTVSDHPRIYSPNQPLHTGFPTPAAPPSSSPSNLLLLGVG